MKRFLLFLLALLLMPHPALAQQLDDAGGGSQPKPISITITKSLYLPPEMYGHWSVTGTLVESNVKNFFNPVVHDIWVLEREGDRVVLSNPVSGASADINVDKVDDDTATFHRMVVKKDRIMLEMPTITVEGNTLYGTSINKFQQIKNGRVVKSWYSQYRLEAKRIGQDRLKFGDTPPPEDVEFEIEDVLPRRPSQNPAYQ